MSDNKKDIYNKAEYRKEISERTLLQKDNLSSRVLQDSERLIAALFLVTDLIDRDEPLRAKIRTKGLELLTITASWGESRRVDHSLQDCVAEILSLLRIAVCVGCVSFMNADVLRREFHKLLFTARKREDAQRKLSVDFFVQDDQNNNVEGGAFDSSVWTSDLLKQLHTNPFEIGSLHKGHSEALPDRRKSAAAKKNNDAKGQNSTVPASTTRRETILSIVRDKGKVSVKDIAAVIQGCSEKTLQRDLVSMVEEGVLKKEGERRWSVYLLA